MGRPFNGDFYMPDLRIQKPSRLLETIYAGLLQDPRQTEFLPDGGDLTCMFSN